MITLPNEPRKINFVVGIHRSYDTVLTGGVIAMHRLAYLLADKGHNVFIFTKPEYPHSNIVQIPSKITKADGFVDFFEWEKFSYMYHNTVSIYPQTTRSNPYGTKHVTRWILYDTEQSIEAAYGPDDIYANFGKFKTYRTVQQIPLTVFDYRLKDLYITNYGKRKGFCHILHKHTPPNGEAFINQLSTFDLTNWKTNGAYDYLREQLNQYEYMLTYDQKSFYTIAAGLCGCKSIILNPGKSYEFAPNAYSESPEYFDELTPEKYREQNIIQKYGVAYGLDDINWANQTIKKVRPHIIGVSKTDMETVDNFVKYWENKLFN